MNIGANSGCNSTGSKKRGIEYHRRVYTLLRTHFGRLAGGKETGWELLIEPWYKRLPTKTERAVFRQPDAVLIRPAERTAIVIEVKLNWKDGRDNKLLDEYIHIVRKAEGLEVVWPILITQCLRGYQHPPILGLDKIERCQSWFQGDPTPLMLLV